MIKLGASLGGVLEQITIRRDSGKPLARQIFEQISGLILDGKIRPGERLPSSRALAEELGISRNVALEATDQLIAEGFLESRKGSGVFAASGIGVHPKSRRENVEFEKIGFEEIREDIVDFRSGLPDMDYFPRYIWLRITKEIYSCSKYDPLSYNQPEGSLELRKEIAAYVCSRRGANCDAGRIVITSGTTQAVNMASKLLVTQKKHIAFLEDPITCDIQAIIKSNGATVRGVELEADGIKTPPDNPSVSFIYVTPSHQFPIGYAMSVQKRNALLDYANRNKAYIVEDDYDSEFRFDGPPVSCIQGLDPDKVIYIGTFSKTLCPAFRIAYMILPDHLVAKGRRQKWFMDLHNPVPNQLILAEFLARGHYTRHIAKMRRLYKKRRETLEAELYKNFGKKVEILGSRTGIHLCARFRGYNFDNKLLSLIEDAGCKVYPVEKHTINKGKYSDTLILGYGRLPEEKITEGIKIFATAIRG